MNDRSRAPLCHKLLTIFIGSVWVFHGLYSKISNGIPRHRQIVERILGEGIAESATLAIGLLEIGLGLWIFSGFQRRTCALMQTLALVSMNFLEILLAKDLLISASGMVALNLGFIALIWYWASVPEPLEIKD
ncbi:MAG: DoxX-like family protein [Verrucomicrobiota bacterium]